MNCFPAPKNTEESMGINNMPIAALVFFAALIAFDFYEEVAW